MLVTDFLTRTLTPRGRVFLLLAVAGLLAGLDRDGLVAAIAGVRDFLRMPNDELEIAYGALNFGFYVALVGGGFFAEWLGTRRALFICGVTAAAATALTGFAWSLTVLMLFRLALGLAIGAMIPAATLALIPWTPPRERGWAQGVLHGGLAAGGIAAGPVLWFADFTGSWRSAFLLFGALGAVWAMWWHLWFQPRPVRADEEPPAPMPAPPPIYWRGALVTMALPLALAFVQGWGMELCQSWLPPFLVSFWHFDIKLSSTVAVVGCVAPILGSVLGGMAADRSLGHSGNIKSAHQLTPGVGFLLAAFSFMMLPIGENEVAIAIWLGLALFGLQASLVMLWVFAMDVGGIHPGVSAGFIGLGLTLARLLSPMHLVAVAGMWSLPLILGIPMLIGAGVFSFRLRPHIELPLRPVVEEPAAPAAKGAKAHA
jgi:predicted MFS family arabinose efflux permease